MIGILVGAVGAVAALAYWVTAASYLYCRLSHHLDLFVFPFDQWFEAAGLWNVNHWTLLDVVISGVVPIAIPAAIGWNIYSRRKDSAGKKLYGDGKFADKPAMVAGGFTLKKRNF